MQRRRSRSLKGYKDVFHYHRILVEHIELTWRNLKKSEADWRTDRLKKQSLISPLSDWGPESRSADRIYFVILLDRWSLQKTSSPVVLWLVRRSCPYPWLFTMIMPPYHAHTRFDPYEFNHMNKVFSLLATKCGTTFTIDNEGKFTKPEISFDPKCLFFANVL